MGGGGKQIHWFEAKLKARETKNKIHHPSGEEGGSGIFFFYPRAHGLLRALAQDDLTRRKAEHGSQSLLQ